MTVAGPNPRPSLEVPVERYRFEDDGTFPNNARLPVLIYRGALDDGLPPSAPDFEALFAANTWLPAWRSGLFGFHHYHSTAHETLGVYAGHGQVWLGGPSLGECVCVRPGDVIVIPAGVAHKDEGSSMDFRLVGAYPRGQQWDMMYGTPGERPTAERNIERTPLPQRDPLYGADGPLMRCWAGPD
ncbi:MAG: hypothetical protein J5I81_06775 [Nitrococcus mobilis]|nr:hypothetical protein [Nitrococcus mobilis]